MSEFEKAAKQWGYSLDSEHMSGAYKFEGTIHFKTGWNAREPEIESLRGWIKCANQFVWAHERTCPRHDADEPCNCGLDSFLSRPRPFLDSYKAEIESLRRQLVKAAEYSEKCDNIRIETEKDLAKAMRQLATCRDATRVEDAKAMCRYCKKNYALDESDPLGDGPFLHISGGGRGLINCNSTPIHRLRQAKAGKEVPCEDS